MKKETRAKWVETGWLARNVACEGWRERRRVSRWLATKALLGLGLFAAGLAFSALFEMVVFPRSPERAPPEPLAHAQTSNCERELAGVPSAFRSDGETSARMVFGCRREGARELVERWRADGVGRARPESGSGSGLPEGLGEIAADPLELKGFERLDALPWRETEPEPGWRAFLELAGAAELTAVSRGWRAGSGASGADSAAALLGESGLGLVKGLGLVVWAGVTLWPAWVAMLTGGLGWALVDVKNPALARSWRGVAGAALAGVALSLTLGVWVSAGGAMWAGERMLRNADGERVEAATRSIAKPDCDRRLSRAGLGGSDRRLACREEGGEMRLIVATPASWTDEKASRFAAEALRMRAEDVRLGPSEGARAERSWSAFGELAGWSRATGATRGWVYQTPRMREGAWSWARAERMLERGVLGVWAFLALTILSALVALGVRGLGRSIKGGMWSLTRIFEAIARDPVFCARASQREWRWSRRKEARARLKARRARN